MKKRKLQSSINGKKKEKKEQKKKEEEEAAVEDEGMIGVLLLFLFIYLFIFFEELVFFFSGSFFPYKSLCSRSEIIRSPSDLCSSSCSFISCRSDYNFIPVYWPKFIGKAETKRNRLNLKNRSRFSEPYGSHGSLLFSHWAVLEAKKNYKTERFTIFPVGPYSPVRVSKPHLWNDHHIKDVQ